MTPDSISTVSNSLKVVLCHILYYDKSVVSIYNSPENFVSNSHILSVSDLELIHCMLISKSGIRNREIKFISSSLLIAKCLENKV